jgi:hypothetical protein
LKEVNVSGASRGVIADVNADSLGKFCFLSGGRVKIKINGTRKIK